MKKKPSGRPHLLDLLQPGALISGEVLAERLDISRQALHKQITVLRKQGYKLEGKTRSGYRLISAPERWSADRMAQSLGGRTFGRELRLFDSVESTQTEAKNWAALDAPEGALVLAERQSSGKGRLGRAWISEAGGVWASLILRPRIPPQDAPLLSLVFSLGAAEGIERACGVPCHVKWPNDVMIDVGILLNLPRAPYRKVCGILAEMSAEAERVHWVVLGFGINANNPVPRGLDFSAIRLQDIVDGPVDRLTLLASVLECMEKAYGRFLAGGFPALKSEYLRRLMLGGRKITVSDLRRRHSGRFLDVADDGELVLMGENGKKLKFSSGDVTLAK